ncbi:threonine/serine dehydratase [Caulobacter mirabilis]|uniref:Pyridoxal-5'-phosphate-dependent protein n=1 Tax=Caulobacter mirabilis TaxID=69666 RepID=A0A2D2ASE3_9CAUL|nr:threonine/serine dehydratase [Caulobacter mirabilis]ATQ40930.1 pyridoxal-5'-phosphate-dependent protein [Caulobacter mirabilis]
MSTVAFADIEAAAARLDGLAVKTPLIESPALNDQLGARVLLKPETLQRGGAFKFRGAMNKIAQLTDEQRARGVVACSSGNHAQGVALAARMLGAPAVIVMPQDAPAMKVANTRAYGAEVIHYDRYTEDREAITQGIAQERGMTIVWPFDDVDIIAGQGTVGLELVRQAEAVGARLDVVLAPVGGGGLIAGVSTAVKALSKHTGVLGVEPADFDDTRRSLESGRREIISPDARGICDALQSPSPGAITFPINQGNLDGVATVTDAEVAEAIRYAYTTLKLVIEPGGAVGLAALLSGAVDAETATVGVVLSGGNIDPGLFARILAGEI